MIKKMSEAEARKFTDGCREFKNYKTIEEYTEDVVACLIYSPWHYTEEEARDIVKGYMWYVKKAYEEKELADDCCAEVGYSCG